MVTNVGLRDIVLLWCFERLLLGYIWSPLAVPLEQTGEFGGTWCVCEGEAPHCLPVLSGFLASEQANLFKGRAGQPARLGLGDRLLSSLTAAQRGEQGPRALGGQTRGSAGEQHAEGCKPLNDTHTWEVRV